MLRNPASTSTLADLEHGQFQLVIGDTLAPDPASVRRVVLCSGKVYYDVAAEHAKRGVRDVALVRVEQLYPFPRAEVRAELDRYPNAKELVWCQEEPQNQGAWYQIRHHLDIVAQGLTLSYAGRPRSPAPACGHLSTHNLEQAALISDALGSGATPTKD
jgi:2-oxoglutarate dehydrogenase E1 component